MGSSFGDISCSKYHWFYENAPEVLSGSSGTVASTVMGTSEHTGDVITISTLDRIVVKVSRMGC